MDRGARLLQQLNDPRLWTLRELAPARTVSTGHAPLDSQLPGGGWPWGAITELMPERPGIGELSLLAPALGRLAIAGQRLALVSPPYRACAPGWMQADVRLEQLLLVEAARPGDALWASELLLRSGAFGAVLLWAAAAPERALRRLQLAAEQGGSILFLFRPADAARQASPAALRLRLKAGLHIDILKSRGGQPRSLQLVLPGRHARPVPVPSHAVVMPLPAAPAARCAGG